MNEQLPEVISEFSAVLEQVHKLIADIEKNRWDGGVVVMINNGAVDVRGLGVVDSTTAASAMLFAAIKALPPVSQEAFLKALLPLMERSERVEKEAREIWMQSDSAKTSP